MIAWSRRRLLAGLGSGLVTPALPLGCTTGRERPPRFPTEVATSLPPIEQGRFDDGMGLLLAQDHTLPLVSMALVLRAGHRHDPRDQPGVARLAGMMLLEGIDGGDRRDLLDRFGDLGTTPELGVGPSQLWLQCTVQRDEAAAALALLFRTLRHSSWAPEAFERVRGDRRERLESLQGSPDAVVSLGLLEGVFGATPPITAFGEGTPASLATLELAQVRDRFALRLRPDAAVVLLTGAVSKPEALEWIAAARDGWVAPSQSLPPEPTPPELPPDDRPRIVLVPWSGLEQAVIGVGGLHHPYGTPEELPQAQADAIMVGLLDYELRTRQRTSYGVRARTWQTQYGALHQLWARVEPGDTGRALRGVREHLARIVTGTLDPSIVEDTRTQALVELMEDAHGLEPMLSQLLRLVAASLPPEALPQRLERLQRLDGRHIEEALRESYQASALRWCVVGNEAALERAVRELPRAGVVTRSASALFGGA